MGLFDKLKKKEEFSMDLPPLPQLPPLPPVQPAYPQQQYKAPQAMQRPAMAPPPIPPPEEDFSLEMPEEIPLEIPEPMDVEPQAPVYREMLKQPMPMIELPKPEIKPMRPEVFIKIDKYKEIMRNIGKIKEELAEVQADMSELNKLDNEEREKISAGQVVLDRVNKMMLFLDETFTSAE